MNRLLDQPRLVFTLVFIWKVALLVFTSQPIPENDSYFYDGPVVHLLNQGGYFNPSITLARPISGSEIFSAYLPTPKGPVFMGLIEKTFGKEQTTRTWDTIVKVAR